MDPYELAYEYVLHTNRCIFLTGKAGTGKTTFLRKLISDCHKQMSVVAPTGVAAINAEGVTIHSLMQLPPQVFIPTDNARRQLFAEMQMRDAKRRVLNRLELLVIDEISMVRADLLDTIDAVLRKFKHCPNLPFGGVQVLMIGDLYQLSPVAKEEEWQLMKEWYTGPYFFQARVFSELKPIYIELNKVFRQSNPEFIEILNQVRTNTLSPSGLAQLNSRYIPDAATNSDSNKAIVLTTHNRKADAVNQMRMDALNSREYTFAAEIKDSFPESMYPINPDMRLKKGARVMFIKNDSSPEKEYYNGKLGEIVDIDRQQIIVHCDDGINVAVHKETWENIKYTTSSIEDEIHPEVIGTFTHYPLRLAWAITIHKAQGLTFDNVIIDAADAFAAGQVYVALSRCRSLEGITLTTRIPARALSNSKAVVSFTAEQVSLSAAEKELSPSQCEYRQQLLCNMFDFRFHLENLYHLRGIGQKMTSLQGDFDAWMKLCCTPLEEIAGIGEKFQNQIRQILLGQAVSEERETLLQSRLNKAAAYFSPTLDQVIELLNNCPIRSNDREDARVMQGRLEEIFSAISKHSFLLSHIDTANSIQGIFKIRSIFQPIYPDASIYTGTKKVKVSRQGKGGSKSKTGNGTKITKKTKSQETDTPKSDRISPSNTTSSFPIPRQNKENKSHTLKDSINDVLSNIKRKRFNTAHKIPAMMMYLQGKDIHQVAHQLKINEEEACSYLRELIENGVLKTTQISKEDKVILERFT